MKLLQRFIRLFKGIEVKSQQHEILLTMLEYFPEKVPSWVLITRTKSTCYGKVVSDLRKKLRELYEKEYDLLPYGDPLISETEKGINQYGNRSKEGTYRLNPRYHQAAIILEHKLRK